MIWFVFAPWGDDISYYTERDRVNTDLMDLIALKTVE